MTPLVPVILHYLGVLCFSSGEIRLEIPLLTSVVRLRLLLATKSTFQKSPYVNIKLSRTSLTVWVKSACLLGLHHQIAYSLLISIIQIKGVYSSEKGITLSSCTNLLVQDLSGFKVFYHSDKSRVIKYKNFQCNPLLQKYMLWIVLLKLHFIYRCRNTT